MCVTKLLIVYGKLMKRNAKNMAPVAFQPAVAIFCLFGQKQLPLTAEGVLLPTSLDHAFQAIITSLLRLRED